MRASRRADDVKGIRDIGDPVAQRLVHRILERACAGHDRDDFGPQQLHAKDVGPLPGDVGFAHVNGARQIEMRRDGTREDSTANPISLAESTGKRPRRRTYGDHGRAIAALGKPLYILASGVVGPSATATASVSSER